MNQSTIAIIQAAPCLFDQAGTLDRFAHWLTEAKKAAVDLIVFPETFLGGYPKGVDFGARVGSRTPEGRELFSLYYETAFTRNGDAFDKARAMV